MLHIPFDYYALHYLNLWAKSERQSLDDIQCKDESRPLRGLASAASNFRVARTLPREKDGVDRYQPVLDVLKRQSATTFHGKDPTALANVVLNVSKEISEHYGNGTLSATTKLLWMKFPGQVIIYDEQARVALHTDKWELQEFYRRWRADFEEHKTAIVGACERLAGAQAYWHPDASRFLDDVANVTQQSWFHERVFDSYLWHKGNNRKKKTPADVAGR